MTARFDDLKPNVLLIFLRLIFIVALVKQHLNHDFLRYLQYKNLV
ncbi:hypothetical protein SC1083_2052 [Aggregatibacter actinomycetemcomitans serotype e str. SC1083]|uniref:Uncharacterized protein n=1 Tax=Aggregatibacter actinomycetemcomitans serotype e str. SC1083 TaxID=907488 RepID=G4AB22_AGGAC|nr:hypothetical protein SC1083_2052 [Aggregatibacter actinomycetemcomitans serotype e str. SC1083]